MRTPSFQNPTPSHVSVEVQIPEELEFYLAEAAEDLEISPEELVQQAVGSYCRVKLGGHHE